MKLVTSEMMHLIDREAIDKQGIPGQELMENAGRGIAERLLSFITPTDSVSVFCGKGNNGGDGFVIGRYLHLAGVKVTVYFLGPPSALASDAHLNFDKAVGLNLDINSITDSAEIPAAVETDYILDAILGTGFSGVPRGLAAELIEFINLQNGVVISVDIPSGLNADGGNPGGVAVRADQTLTLALPKFGLYHSPGRELAGQVEVVPIGIPDEVVNRFDLRCDLVTGEQVLSLLPKRKPDGHKGDFGRLYLVAGSMGMSGAAALAAEAGLRGGCGMVKVGCAASVLPLIAATFREATTQSLPEVAKKGVLALRGLGEIAKEAAAHNAIVLGPGLSQHHQTMELVRRLIDRLKQPTLIDADGLNAFAGRANLLTETDTPLVLTPHPGEFRRLSGTEVPVDIHQRIDVATNFARTFRCTLVLKGSPTLVANQYGDVKLNPTGNSGMATGGSGDVLSGMIGSFLAQGSEPFKAAICGVYLHGLAGDLAADELNDRVMIAGDIIHFMPDAFHNIGC